MVTRMVAQQPNQGIVLWGWGLKKHKWEEEVSRWLGRKIIPEEAQIGVQPECGWNPGRRGVSAEMGCGGSGVLRSGKWRVLRMPRQEMTLHCRRRRLTNAGSDRVQMTFSLKVARDSRGQGRWSLSLTNRESVLGGPCPRQAEARVGTRDRAVTQGTAVTTLDLEPLNHHGTPKVHSYIWEEKIFFF